jgi:hypothetical protein
MLKIIKIIYLHSLKKYLKKKKNYNKKFFSIIKNYYNVYSKNSFSWSVASSYDIINFYNYKNNNNLNLVTIFNQKWFFFKV